MIPKIIHQIWLQGYDSMPNDLKTYYHLCQNINNDFQHIFWDEQKIKKLLTKKYDPIYLNTYNTYTIKAQQADFARYCILYIYGGIYLDMDTICKKNLLPFLKNKFFFTSTRDLLNIIYRRYQTGIIGTIPKHPLFPIIFQNMFDRIGYMNNVTYSTGTKMFYDSVHQYIKKYDDNDGIRIIDPKYLHPCGIFDDEMCMYKCDDCYIVHTNYSSWTTASQIIKYLIKHSKLVIIAIIVIVFLIVVIRKFERR